MAVHQVHIALNAFNFWMLFACIGLLILRAWLLPAARLGAPDWLQHWHRLFFLMLAMLTGSGIALFLVRVMEMANSSLGTVLPLLPQVLQQTHFGHVWSLHLFALVVLWIGWGLSRRASSPAGLAIMLMASLLLAFTHSAASHAADQGDFSLAEINDWLHLLAAAAWGGGILGTLFFIFQERYWADGLLIRLSDLSTFALPATLATGVYNTALRLDSFAALFNTSYGRVLAVKIFLVGSMIFIGAINRLILIPRIRHKASSSWQGNPGIRAFRLTLSLDALLVLMILTAAAILIESMPAMPEM